MADRHWRFGRTRPGSVHSGGAYHDRAGWAGVGGTVGGIAGALIGMGIPEYEAKRYEGQVKNGGILLSVHSDNSDSTKRAKEILKRTGAQDIAATGEASVDEPPTEYRLKRVG